ncbi:MAG: hypothetical protein MJK04_23520, partial [Psychrosphaera sp.]|nr:hypothetical protein [Psychrosphaera sp.]
MNRLFGFKGWQCLTLLLAALSLSSCQFLHAAGTSKVACGQSGYGEWYDYYWSGLACMDVSNWPKAESELRLALAKRDVDKRRVYTKGMHWITDYFPNRELGITLYELRKFPGAANSLLVSLGQFPSTKAEYYLNRTRKNLPSLISKDTRPPTISSQLKQGNVLILNITDDNFVQHIKINGKYQTWQDIYTVDDAQISIQRAKQSITLIVHLDPETQTELKVEAIDVLNKTTNEIDLSFYLDTSPPQLSLLSTKRAKYDRWHVLGTLTDSHSGIKTLLINGKSDSKLVSRDHQKTVDIDYLTDSDTLTVKATDYNGNTFEKTINLKAKQSLQLLLKPISGFTQEAQVLIEGEIVSGIKINRLLINEAQVKLRDNNKFSFPLALARGKTTISIEVANNNETINEQHSITVLKPDDLPFEERLKVAIFPFECDVEQGVWCDHQQDQKLQAAIQLRRRFNLVPEVDLAGHITKIKKCSVGLIEKCTLSSLRKIETNTALVGQIIDRTRITKTGKNVKGEEAYVRMIDPVTGHLLIAFDAYF